MLVLRNARAISRRITSRAFRNSETFLFFQGENSKIQRDASSSPSRTKRTIPWHAFSLQLGSRRTWKSCAATRPIWLSKALSSRVVASRDSQPAGRQAAPQQHLTPPWTARQEGGESLTSLPSHSIPFLLVQNPSCNLTACVTTFATTKTTGPKSSTNNSNSTRIEYSFFFLH